MGHALCLFRHAQLVRITSKRLGVNQHSSTHLKRALISLARVVLGREHHLWDLSLSSWLWGWLHEAAWHVDVVEGLVLDELLL